MGCSEIHLKGPCLSWLAEVMQPGHPGTRHSCRGCPHHHLCWTMRTSEEHECTTDTLCPPHPWMTITCHEVMVGCVLRCLGGPGDPFYLQSGRWDSCSPCSGTTLHLTLTSATQPAGTLPLKPAAQNLSVVPHLAQGPSTLLHSICQGRQLPTATFH